MKTVLNASTRLLAAKDSSWFEGLSKEAQGDYLTEHPDSDFNKHKSVVNKKPLGSEDKKRLAFLKKNLVDLKEDLADFTEDGDTEWIGKTKKLIDSTSKELKELQSRA